MVSQPPAPSAAAVTDDRRRSTRKPYVCEAWIVSPTAKTPADRIDVSAVNLSKHGLAFETTVALATGTYFELQLGMGPQRLRSEIHVIACRQTGAQRFEIGAEFC